MAFDYCCSLGLRLAELTSLQDVQIAIPGTLKHSDFKMSSSHMIFLKLLDLSTKYRLLSLERRLSMDSKEMCGAIQRYPLLT
jgi:hypothetical protein